MKSPTHPSLSARRRALFAASVAVLCGTSALAQSAGTNATDNPSNQAQPTTKTGSGYHSGTASADADAAREINAQAGKSEDLTPTGRDTLQGDKLSWGDRRFVSKAADDGKAEVQLAELAAQRASHAEVKSFAQKLVDQHTQVNSELTSIAAQKNVKLDDDTDKDRAYQRLSKKSGHEFDQEFVEHMIDEHEKCIRMFEKASTDAKDSDVRAFASKHLEHFRSHLQEAQSLRQSVMPTGRMDENSGRATPAGPTSSDARATDRSTTTPDTGSSNSSLNTPSSSATPKPDSSANPSDRTPTPYPKR